jgi:hypothetical protein
LALALIVLSFPVLFAMERGNCDLLVLLFVLCAICALNTRSAAGDAIAGVLLALGAWVKIYPAIVVLGLLASRRWRAATAMLAAGLTIGLADFSHTLAFASNLATSPYHLTPNSLGTFCVGSHTLTGAWKLFWIHTPLHRLARLPGVCGWLFFIVPVIVWVSHRVYTSTNRSRVLYPYLLWLIAAGTYLPSIAEDYNLFFLPLAVLATWERRGSMVVHVLLAFLVLWWQPVALPLSPKFLWFPTMSGLLGAAGSLVRCARERVAGEMSREREGTHLAAA